MTLVSDLSALSDLSDKLVRHGITRGFACRSEVWLGAELPQGVCGQCDGNGGVRAKDVPGGNASSF